LAFPLIFLSPRDAAGLRWLEGRSRYWLSQLKRSRKYQPPGKFSSKEMELLTALVQLERGCTRILKLRKQEMENKIP